MRLSYGKLNTVVPRFFTRLPLCGYNHMNGTLPVVFIQLGVRHDYHIKKGCEKQLYVVKLRNYVVVNC